MVMVAVAVRVAVDVAVDTGVMIVVAVRVIVTTGDGAQGLFRRGGQTVAENAAGTGFDPDLQPVLPEMTPRLRVSDVSIFDSAIPWKPSSRYGQIGPIYTQLRCRDKVLA